MIETTVVRPLIDPTGKLPVIEVVELDTFSPSCSLTEFQIDHANEEIGSMTIHRGTPESCFDLIYLKEAMRSRGFGLAAYVWAIEHELAEGQGFMTDSSVTEPAVKIWRILAGAGIAQVRHDFVYDFTDAEGVKCFVGEYDIPGPQSTYTNSDTPRVPRPSSERLRY